MKAATGEDVSAEELGGAELHCTTSGECGEGGRGMCGVMCVYVCGARRQSRACTAPPAVCSEGEGVGGATSSGWVHRGDARGEPPAMWVEGRLVGATHTTLNPQPDPYHLTSAVTGVTDHLAESEEHALSLARSVLANLNSPPHPGSAAASGGVWAQQQQMAATAAAATAVGGGGGSSSGWDGSSSGWEEPRFSPDELRGEHWWG